MKREMLKPLCITLSFLLVISVFSVWAIIKPADEYSVSERRKLAQFPKASFDSVKDGRFFESFEKYAADQFPMRDKLRALKATASYDFLLERDNNGLYCYDDTIAKIDYPLDPFMIDNAADLFENITELYLKPANAKVYIAAIPDKNKYLAEEAGRLSLDFDALKARLFEKTPDMTHIEIDGLLKYYNYYYTDTHWKQEEIYPVAKHLADEMGAEIPSFKSYTLNVSSTPFYGVYSGQFAKKCKYDSFRFLSSPVTDGLRVTVFSFDEETGDLTPGNGVLYDKKAFSTDDMYNFFLMGSVPLITIENPAAENEKELVLFRDSFSSSLAPLLAGGYKKVTLVDLRYLPSYAVGDYVSFENADVLFLYSTLVLNDSLQLS